MAKFQMVFLFALHLKKIDKLMGTQTHTFLIFSWKRDGWNQPGELAVNKGG